MKACLLGVALTAGFLVGCADSPSCTSTAGKEAIKTAFIAWLKQGSNAHTVDWPRETYALTTWMISKDEASATCAGKMTTTSYFKETGNSKREGFTLDWKVYLTDKGELLAQFNTSPGFASPD